MIKKSEALIETSKAIIRDHESRTALKRQRGREASAKYRASGACGLQDLNHLVARNHESMRARTFMRAYKGRAIRRGHSGIYGVDIEHRFACIDRQRAFWDALGKVGDDAFKAKLMSEMAEWNAADVVEYADTLDLAYLSVLKQDRAERAAAKEAAKRVNKGDEAAQRKRNAVNEEIRRLESGESSE